MAATNSTSTPLRASHQAALSPADVAAHAAATYVRPTATRRALVRYEICRDTVAELSAMDARTFTPARYERLVAAQDELTQHCATLAAAGLLGQEVAA